MQSRDGGIPSDVDDSSYCIVQTPRVMKHKMFWCLYDVR